MDSDGEALIAWRRRGGQLLREDAKRGAAQLPPLPETENKDTENER